MKLPPFGKILAERQQHNNPPLYAVVCHGLDCWQRAKGWNASPADCCAMVCPADVDPAALSWPVHEVPCVIEAAEGPSFEQVSDLALNLLKAGSPQCFLTGGAFPSRFFRWAA